MKQDPFEDIRNKRLSELSAEQQDRAAELWLRENLGWEDRRLHPTLESVFRVIDRLRAEVLGPCAELPRPGSPEASAMMDSVLAEYNHPSNPKNCARAGYVAAQRLLAPKPPTASGPTSGEGSPS